MVCVPFCDFSSVFISVCVSVFVFVFSVDISFAALSIFGVSFFGVSVFMSLFSAVTTH